MRKKYKPRMPENPKQAFGDTKLPLHLWPASATAVGCLGMLEGMTKYGLVNYRASPVIASTYVAATMRHLAEWYEGSELTPDVGQQCLGNALASLAIIVDAQTHGTLIDNRPQHNNHGYARLIRQLKAEPAKIRKMFEKHHPIHWTQKRADNSR